MTTVITTLMSDDDSSEDDEVVTSRNHLRKKKSIPKVSDIQDDSSDYTPDFYSEDEESNGEDEGGRGDDGKSDFTNGTLQGLRNYFSDETDEKIEIIKKSKTVIEKIEPDTLRIEEQIEESSLMSSPCSLRIENEKIKLNKKSPQNINKPKRKNMSFTDSEYRRIQRENHILLAKIMAQQKSADKVHRANVTLNRVSSSAINRERQQRKISEDNMYLLQRIQNAKSSVLRPNSTQGFRQ
ncbi:cilia- and flagella-associated protein 97-like isoform X3 [Prorops nasuta]|uniref:cilia- and flagella-associated protein 97-like isoform X3 n=1 Tax=Prorops nasuta TaxID=863751 RepID=UPI0034CDC124